MMDRKELADFLSIVKSRLFEPRKNVENDDQGFKTMVDCLNNQDCTKQLLSQIDKKRVEIGEGWNVADKDYVDFKIVALYKQMKNHFDSQLLAKQNVSVNSSTSNNGGLFSKPKPVSNTTIVNSPGVILSAEKTLKFFTPGLVLKKGWTINEVFLHIVPQEDEEIVLNMINVGDQTVTVVSKNKSQQSNGKIKNTTTASQTLLVNEPKLVITSTSIFTFEVKLSGKQQNTAGFLQFVIETCDS